MEWIRIEEIIMSAICRFDTEGKGFDIGAFDYIFLQAILGIIRNNTVLGIIENQTEPGIIKNNTILGIIE